MICGWCRQPWLYKRPKGKGGRNPATNPSHFACKKKRGNENRAISRERERLGLKRKPHEDALQVAWRAGDHIENVGSFESATDVNWREDERHALCDIQYSSAADKRTVNTWFLDTREPKGGAETGRTVRAKLPVIGSAAPWREVEEGRAPGA